MNDERVMAPRDGLCGCGCGQQAGTYKRTFRNRGVVAGEPRRFAWGHAMRLLTRSPEARFWAKVNKTDTCWNWTAAPNSEGYGELWITELQRSVMAHRFGYELLVGSIPDGLTLDHLCRNRLCVNPAHLEPCTSGENVLRGTAPSARNARKTHCKRGHKFTPENTHINPKGSRVCLTCRRDADRVAKREQRARERAERLAT